MQHLKRQSKQGNHGLSDDWLALLKGAGYSGSY